MTQINVAKLRSNYAWIKQVSMKILCCDELLYSGILLQIWATVFALIFSSYQYKFRITVLDLGPQVITISITSHYLLFTSLLPVNPGKLVAQWRWAPSITEGGLPRPLLTRQPDRALVCMCIYLIVQNQVYSFVFDFVSDRFMHNQMKQ